MGVQSPSTLPTHATPVDTEGRPLRFLVLSSLTEHTLYTSRLMKARVCSVTLFNQCYDFQRCVVNSGLISKFDHIGVL